MIAMLATETQYVQNRQRGSEQEHMKQKQREDVCYRKSDNLLGLGVRRHVVVPILPT